MGRRRAAKGLRQQARRPATEAAVGARPPALREERGGPPASATSTEGPEPQALVATYWFDAGEGDAPYTANVRLTGRRAGVRGSPGPGDSFVKDEVIDEVIPGTGPVTITTWVYGVEKGEWSISGTVTPEPAAGSGLGRGRPGPSRPVHPARWSWRRWAVETGPSDPIATRWALLAPLARQPAVLPGIYTALAVLGIILAVVIQTAVLGREGIPTGRSVLASILTIVAGLIGAKVWYAVLHPTESFIRGGWAVDGFLIVFPLVGAVTLLLMDLPIGKVLDATAPGTFFAVAIGRVGCFLTGCCAGRCTASRWGLWTSDRRVGARRIPTQLLESGTGLLLGAVTLILALGGGLPIPGLVFVAGFVIYAAVRQVLLRLRSERRKSPRTVSLTAVAAVVVAIVVAILAATQGS